jgi:hypothetical protein
VLLLVDSLSRCSLGAIIVVTDVTDASVSEARIFLRLSLGSTRTIGRWSYPGER